MDFDGPGKIKGKLLEYNDDDEKTLTIIYQYEGMEDDTTYSFTINPKSVNIIKVRFPDIEEKFNTLDDDTAINYIKHIATEENIRWCTVCKHLHSSTVASPISGHEISGGGKKKKKSAKGKSKKRKSKTKKRCKKCRCQPCLCKKQIHCYQITCNTKKKKRKSKKKSKKIPRKPKK